MHKREFITAALAAAAAVPAWAQAKPARGRRGPALLTVTGAGVKANRGAFDPVRDQMMAKQKISFERAHAFDYAALAALPARKIRPTLEYDNKPHELSGPLLRDVLKAAGVTSGGQLQMRAIDGYAPVISLADADKYGFIVATALDGEPMGLGGLGPLWAVYDADGHPDMAAKPVDQRFAQCPWGLYHIDVQAS